MKFATLAVLVIVGAVFVQNSEAFKCHICTDQDWASYDANCPLTECTTPGINCILTRGAGGKFTGACTADAVETTCPKDKCVCASDGCNRPTIVDPTEKDATGTEAAATRSVHVNLGVVAALLVVPSVAYLKF